MRHLEDSLQRSIIRYLRVNKIFCFSVPNGGSRNKLEAYNLKLSGVLAGVSDLIILMPKRVVFVELKIPTGKQSEYQKAFQKKVEELGFDYYIWRSINDAVQFINKERKN